MPSRFRALTCTILSTMRSRRPPVSQPDDVATDFAETELKLMHQVGSIEWDVVNIQDALYPSTDAPTKWQAGLQSDKRHSSTETS